MDDTLKGNALSVMCARERVTIRQMANEARRRLNLPERRYKRIEVNWET